VSSQRHGIDPSFHNSAYQISASLIATNRVRSWSGCRDLRNSRTNPALWAPAPDRHGAPGRVRPANLRPADEKSRALDTVLKWVCDHDVQTQVFGFGGC